MEYDITSGSGETGWPPRTISVLVPFDLARTVAPVWWARGRWPNVDWREGEFIWVGWESDRLSWRITRQVELDTLEMRGDSDRLRDADWALAVLGAGASMPQFADPVLDRLAELHDGMRPWAAGSLFTGVISAIVGQSISVAAAATTERRLFELFNDPIDLGGRLYWPPPLPAQLASSDPRFIRRSGVTTKRAEALVEVGALFASDAGIESATEPAQKKAVSEMLLAIPSIGPWTVRSALLWGVADEDAHPTGDVALLRAAKLHYPGILTLKDVDRHSEHWAPFRSWAARLLWLDLLGFDLGTSPAREE